MKIVIIAGGLFGYFGMKYLAISFRLVLVALMFLAVILYIVESIKNKYDKISIVVSILGLMMFLVVFIEQLILYKYPELLKFRGYILMFGLIIVMCFIIVGSINYMKTADKRQAFNLKLGLLFLVISIIIVALLVALKKIGVIPE